MGSIEATFRAESGYATAAARPEDAGKAWAPQPQADENIQLARLAVRLHHAAGEPAPGEPSPAKHVAEHAMRYLTGLAPGASGVRAAGILLAGRELDHEPTAITFAGDLDHDLLRAALSAPATFVVVRREGADALPAASVCSDGACRGPFTDPDALRRAASPTRRK